MERFYLYATLAAALATVADVIARLAACAFKAARRRRRGKTGGGDEAPKAKL